MSFTTAAPDRRPSSRLTSFSYLLARPFISLLILALSSPQRCFVDLLQALLLDRRLASVSLGIQHIGEYGLGLLQSR